MRFSLRKKSENSGGSGDDGSSINLVGGPSATPANIWQDATSGFLTQPSPSSTWTRRKSAPANVATDTDIRADPLGLKVLHRPTQAATVDIVFVHGLGGSSRMTWSKDRDLEFFWPLKFLPFEPDIRDARIMTFGYNADFRPGSKGGSTSVLDFAKELLYDLKYAKDDSAGELEELGMGEVSNRNLLRDWNSPC
jgi:hypothetical protein